MDPAGWAQVVILKGADYFSSRGSETCGVLEAHAFWDVESGKVASVTSSELPREENFLNESSELKDSIAELISVNLYVC